MSKTHLLWKVDYGVGDWGMPITHIIYTGDSPYVPTNIICEINSQYPYCAGASQESQDKYLQDKEHAAHIVRCVNAHDALVEALKVAIECDEAGVTMTYRQMHGARAALTAATGENQ